MQAWHEKNLLQQSSPFRLLKSDLVEFPPHWHEEIEIIYVISGELQMGLNNEVYNLGSRDILLVGAGNVHYFLAENMERKLVILQFGLSLFDDMASAMGNRKFIEPLLKSSEKVNNEEVDALHRELEKQLLALMAENESAEPGYRIALKARLYDLAVLLLRRVPTEKYSALEKSKQLIRLERLENVFRFVEKHYEREINLDEVSNIANFSVYHFTRFFKEATGMTFGQYLSSFRVRRAEWYLKNTDESVTQLAFKSGFNSIKTFNRVFKEINGCSPSKYRNSNI